MRKKKSTLTPIVRRANIRFRSPEQADLVRRAANHIDTSLNSFMRSAAEKEARLVLSEPSACLKDHNNAAD